MPSLKFEGLDNYVEQLEKLGAGVSQDIGKAVFAGAAVVADAVRKNIENLPVEPSRHASPENPLRGVTRAQKQGLLDGFGISRIKLDGDYYNVKLGFDGYNSVKTKKYKKGQANAMIARSVNSGSSIRVKNPFVDKAVSSNLKQAEAAMAEALDKAIQERTK